MRQLVATIAAALAWIGSQSTGGAESLVELVDPFLGTAPLTNVRDIGFKPTRRVWAGLTFPGASLPHAMVQLSPITDFHSGAGYEYEDETLCAFAHTNKGHWNLGHVAIMPVTGAIDSSDFASPFRHSSESASPGSYRVFLDRYDIHVELTTTLRCGLHRYRFPTGTTKKLILNLGKSMERVDRSSCQSDGVRGFYGAQESSEKVYFYATVNHDIRREEVVGEGANALHVFEFDAGDRPLEVRVGLSFVSVEGARKNLEREVAGRDFDTVRDEAAASWEELLGKVRTVGGTNRERRLFYSCLYRSFLWPALRSDGDGRFTDASGRVVQRGFDYYTDPSLWDDYRNKLVLVELLLPGVASDVIASMIDRGGCTGFMPTFFHGDHAAPFIAGAYGRGLRGFVVRRAYELLLRNAMEEHPDARPNLAEYLENGYVATPYTERPDVETRSTAGVTKTLEYAYDDYAVGLLAETLGDKATYVAMKERSRNYRRVYDTDTQLMRGRLADGSWVTPFDPQQPYYEYMYREANAWQSSFFAPHDTPGLISLFGGPAAFERQLDRLYSIPWNPSHIAMNVNSFIGQYCHGNQPDHGFPYLYHWVGRPEKTQAIIDECMSRFYGMDDGRTLAGMDDAGEMSAWYVFNALGFYPYSPADPEYVLTAPVFKEASLAVGGVRATIRREGDGRAFRGVTIGDHRGAGFVVPHRDLLSGREVTIHTIERRDTR